MTTETITEVLTSESPETVSAATNAMSSFVSNLTLERILYAVGLIVASVIVVKILMAVFRKLLGKLPVESHLHNSILSFLRFVLVFLAILLISGTLGIDTSSLLTILGVAALAIAFSIQNTLADVVSAITIFFAKPIRVGDYIHTGEHFGRVDTIGLLYTRILTLEGHFVYIPNKIITSGAIKNYTDNGNCCVEIKVGIDYSYAPAEVKAALERAAEVPNLVAPSEVLVYSYDDSSIAYILRVFTTQEFYRGTYFLLMERVKQTLDANGISIAYPQIVVHNAKEK